MNASLNSSEQQDKQTTHNNSTLTANNLNIATTGDTTIIGGNLHGANAVNMVIGGDLTLESVQDRFSGSNKGMGISGGMSLGGVFTNENGAKANSKEVKTTAIGQGGDVSSVNGGVNASNGRYQKTETVLSSITGGTVDVSVDGNTQLTGALLAAVDAEGNDTGNLSLSTDSLNTTDLTNRSYSSNQSVGVNASVGVSDVADPADPNQSNTDLALNSSNYSYQNESSQSLDKTLATIGEGNVAINDESTLADGVNRDVAQVNKEIYDVDRQQGDVDLTVDHRLLSEDGREQIAKDVEVIQEAAGDAAYNLGAEGVTQFLYDIDDANISAALQDNAEETLDLLIASDVDPVVAKALLTNPEFYNTVASILTNGDALGEGSQLLSDTSDNTEQPPHTPGQPLDITITEGLSTTPVQNVLLGLKDVEGFVSGLPAEEAQAAMIGLGLLTGGVVKTAVDVAKDTVVDTALGAQIRHLQQNVAKVVAAGATGVDVGTHERLMEVESGSGFSTDLQTGSEFGLEVIGLGTGVVLTKKKGDGGSTSARSTDTQELETSLSPAQRRQHEMLEEDVGYNVSPSSWDSYPALGKEGTYITDKTALTDVIGEFGDKKKITVSPQQAFKLERALGLQEGSIKNGFKIRRINNVTSQNPRSPYEGSNNNFQGAGEHLPGGGPEAVINSVPTSDTEISQVIVEITVGG